MECFVKYYILFIISLMALFGFGIYADYCYKMEKLRLIEKGILTTIPEKI